MSNDRFSMCLASDLFRVKKLKSVFVALILMFLILFLTFAVCWVGSNLVSKVEVSETPSIEGETAPTITQEEKDGLLAALDSVINDSLMGSGAICLMEFLVMIITCIFVGKDFSNGTMRILVSRGANRVHLFISKWLTMAILVVAYSLFALLVSGILYAFKNDGSFTGYDFGILMRCFSLQLLCNLASMTISLMIAFLCRSSGSALGVSIGLYIILSVALSIISTVVSLSGGNQDWMMFMPMQQMNVAASAGSYSTDQLCAVIIMPIVYIAIAFAVGVSTFVKRDIK